MKGFYLTKEERDFFFGSALCAFWIWLTFFVIYLFG